MCNKVMIAMHEEYKAHHVWLIDKAYPSVDEGLYHMSDKAATNRG